MENRGKQSKKRTVSKLPTSPSKPRQIMDEFMVVERRSVTRPREHKVKKAA